MKEDKKSVTKGWLIAGGIVAVLAISTPFIIMGLSATVFNVTDISKLGTIGDFFGGSTVGLLSLASILFVIHTIAIQGKELALTREEFKTGNTTAKVQQIDNAFFNMLSLHHQIVNDIKLSRNKDIYQSRAAIEKLKEIYEDSFGKRYYSLEHIESGFVRWNNNENIRKKYINQIFNEYDSITQEELDEVYQDFHEKYGNVIGHYMRNNYRIVKFIVNNVAKDENDQNEINIKTGREPVIGDKKYYFGMLRAQWSNAEFELILINALYTENHKFKDLILKYDVFDMEDSDNRDPHVFKLKDSMNKFNAYRRLIEVEK